MTGGYRSIASKHTKKKSVMDHCPMPVKIGHKNKGNDPLLSSKAGCNEAGKLNYKGVHVTHSLALSGMFGSGG